MGWVESDGCFGEMHQRSSMVFRKSAVLGGPRSHIRMHIRSPWEKPHEPGAGAQRGYILGCAALTLHGALHVMALVGHIHDLAEVLHMGKAGVQGRFG